MNKKSEETKVLIAFYNTIGQGGELSEMSDKACRRVHIDGNWESAHYSETALIKATKCLLRNKDLDDNYSQATLSSLIADRLITIFIREPNKVSEQIDALLNELLNVIPMEMNVYMSIHGITGLKRVKIGEFEFIPAADYSSLGVKCPQPQMESCIKDGIWKNQDHVMVSVPACDPAKAREKAYAEFQWLENVARLFVDSNFHDIGITSFNYSRIENALVTTVDGNMQSASLSVKGSPLLLPFEKFFESDLCRIIDKLGRRNDDLTKLQRRIRHAVYLGGLSVHETIPEVSFFLGVSAMEALFQSETDKYVNPSIAQQIVEAFCYLVVDEKDRRGVFEQMRTFYGKRSAIAHGGKTIVTIDDARLVRSYLRAAILKFIDDPVLSSLKSINEVSAIIRDKKFGVKEPIGLHHESDGKLNEVSHV